METNVLGRERIGKLLRAYAIPSIISMLVNALYNIVDQIFIGWSIWKCCNKHARLCIRIFLGGIILTCYIKSAAIILQSMGNSVKSTVLALLRDVIIFVPASIIIATISESIVTMLWVAVISDVIAAIIGFIFVQTEIKKCEKLVES